MIRLTKRDGTQDGFLRSKVEESLRRAGASDDVISGTLQRVTPTDGESTASFRNRIVAELRSRSPETARRYESSRRLDLARTDSLVEGTALVSPYTLHYYGWEPNDAVNVQRGNRTVSLKVDQSATADVHMMCCSPRTLKIVGASEGARVTLTQNRQPERELPLLGQAPVATPTSCAASPNASAQLWSDSETNREGSGADGRASTHGAAALRSLDTNSSAPNVSTEARSSPAL
ncbi:hypothetical protein JXD38_10660 [candidate division WOR-3 bacterium]|nr:hypothetical protein [candidate division WOR-3 bacterium]